MTLRLTLRPLSASRCAAWAFVFALLLKAAVPMMASASAHAQGKTVFEVCTVYGVSTIVPGGHSDDSDPVHPAAGHTQDHCALTALIAFGAPEPTGLAQPAPAVSTSPIPQAAMGRATPDACAAWAARLRHAPPIAFA